MDQKNLEPEIEKLVKTILEGEFYWNPEQNDADRRIVNAIMPLIKSALHSAYTKGREDLEKETVSNWIGPVCHCGKPVDMTNADCIQFSLCEEHQMEA